MARPIIRHVLGHTVAVAAMMIAALIGLLGAGEGLGWGQSAGVQPPAGQRNGPSAFCISGSHPACPTPTLPTGGTGGSTSLRPTRPPSPVTSTPAPVTPTTAVPSTTSVPPSSPPTTFVPSSSRGGRGEPGLVGSTTSVPSLPQPKGQGSGKTNLWPLWLLLLIPAVGLLVMARRLVGRAPPSAGDIASAIIAGDVAEPTSKKAGS